MSMSPPPKLCGIGGEKSLLQRHHPSLVRKLRELGVQPLQLAMPWIQFGFVTYLEADQARATCRVSCFVYMIWDDPPTPVLCSVP